MQTPSEYPRLSNQHQRWLVRAVCAGGCIALLCLAAPLVWAAVSAGAGIAALAAMAAVGLVAFQSIPLGMQKLENRLMQLHRAEARRNPVEQLQNEMLRRAQRLKAFRNALVTVGGQIESIAQMLAERQHSDPEHVLERQARALQRLKQFHGINLNRLVQAQAALEEFRLTVQRKESEWNIATEIDRATRVMDPHAADQLLQDLMTDTALRAVQDRFNTVFAELDIQMSASESPTRGLLDAHSLDHLGTLDLPAYQVPRSDA